MLILSFCAALFCGCADHSDVRVIKLAHGLNVDHSVHKAMVKMGKDLEEISGGKMKVEIYPNQQLGTERQCLELLQIGSLDMTKVSSGVLESFAPKMSVFGVPFLFRDREQLFRVLDGDIGKSILQDGEKYMLKGLAYYDAGSRSFYTKETPVNKPEDIAGLKIRVMESNTAMNMVIALGGSPTPISWGELYTALQQGVVDGAENNPPSFYLSKHYEVCKYYSLDEHTALPDVLIAGTQFWNRLSDQEKEWLQEAVDRSVPYQRKLWAQSEEEALNEIKKAGVKIIKPDKSLFAKDTESIIESYRDDPDMYELIRKIKAIK